MAPLSSKTFSEIEPLVIAQHESSVDLLTYGGLKDGIRLPGLPETLDILGENLTSAQIQEILQMQEAALLIEPQKPFSVYLNAIDHSGMRFPQRRRTWVFPSVQSRLAAMPSSSGVRVGFVEGHAKPAGDPSLMGSEIKAQGALVRAGLPEGVTTIHPRSYALIQVRGRQTGQAVVDLPGTWSILDDGLTEQRSYFGGNYSMFHVSVNGGYPEYDRKEARWRRAVMMEKN